MSHSTVLVVLPAAAVAESDIDSALAAALEPFDENKDTPEYIAKTKARLIEEQREEYTRYRDEGLYAEYLKDPAAYREKAGHNPGHIRYVSETFPTFLDKLDDDAWLYEQATQYDKDRLDADGNLLSSYNPKSKWDWYSVGGRWAGSVMNWTDTTIHHPAEKRSETWTTEAWDENVGGSDIIQKKDLQEFSGTFAMLTADGEWHQRGKMGWFGMVADEQPQDDWDAKQKQLVEDIADEDWLVVVDVHI